MPEKQAGVVNRPFLARVFVLGACFLFFVFAFSSDNHPARSSPLAQPIYPGAPDLCALFPSGEDYRVEPASGEDGGTYACQLYDIRDQNKFYVVSIKNYETALSAYTQAQSYSNRPGTEPGMPNWGPSGFGDAGFGFEYPGFPEASAYYNQSARLAFARGCYFFEGDAGWWNDGRNLHYNDLSGVYEIASMVDGALGSLPCADSPGGNGGTGQQGTGSPVPTSTATTEPPSATATSTPEIDLRIDHMEVVQVIQTEDNQIPLVAGKKTVVRVFLRADKHTEGDNSYLVDGTLFVWPEGKSEVEVKAGNYAVVSSNKPPVRDRLDNSLNFVLPPDLTSAGVFSLRAVVNHRRFMTESDYDNNELTEPFEFVQRRGLRVGYVRIGYRPPFQSTFSWPGADLDKYGALLKKLIPAADADVQYYEMPWRVRHTRSASTSELGEDLLAYLREFYERLEGDKPDILVGWISSKFAAGFEYGGLAEVAEAGQLGRVLISIDYSSDYSMETLAHEVGHDLGLEHTATRADPNPPCRKSYNSDLNSVGINSYWPSEYKDSAAIRILGFDTTVMQVIPDTYYDIMSYCSPNAWITRFHYKRLFDQNVLPPNVYSVSTPGWILTRGWGWVRGGGGAPRFEMIRSDDSGGGVPSRGGFGLDLADSLLFANQPRPGALFQREGEGDYCLRFVDSGGKAIYERCFDIAFEDTESFATLDEAGFVLKVPDPGNFVRAEVVYSPGGVERETVALEKGAPPSVTITSPRAGENWEGEHTITWEGTDSDSDELRYDILYSPDGKATWYPLEVASRETSYTFLTDEILPGDQTYIRVAVSDGFDTTHAEIGPLVVPSQPNSPQPPPPPPSAGAAQSPAGNIAFDLRKLNWGLVGIVGGGVVALLVVFVVFRASRRPKPKQAMAESARFCGRCGSALPQGIQFCGNCGTPVPRL